MGSTSPYIPYMDPMGNISGDGLCHQSLEGAPGLQINHCGLMVYRTQKHCKYGDGGSYCFTHIIGNQPGTFRSPGWHWNQSGGRTLAAACSYSHGFFMFFRSGCCHENRRVQTSNLRMARFGLPVTHRWCSTNDGSSWFSGLIWLWGAGMMEVSPEFLLAWTHHRDSE